jgi:hypothetical protein
MRARVKLTLGRALAMTLAEDIAAAAMQKVEGSNPFSRFRKDLHSQVFFVLRPTGPRRRG